jgi:hypothetical protein
MNLVLRSIFVHTSKGSLTHRGLSRHWSDGVTSPPNEGAPRIFITLKNSSPSGGFEPSNLGANGKLQYRRSFQVHKSVKETFNYFNSRSFCESCSAVSLCLATGWTTGRSKFGPRQRRRDFSSSLCVQTGSGARPASCTMGTGGTRPGRNADHSPTSSAEVDSE